ncbi:MAG TPA: HEAT repeat domain-containing protein, partial [Vicinamibacterales bacterium]|nr:HEAT repeat domain-containing protein [Vicinamibacterales bacterium]
SARADERSGVPQDGTMIRNMRSIAIGLIITASVCSPALAQTPRPESDAQILGRGWAAVAAGRFDEAANLSAGILKRKPRSHAAITLKIEAISGGAQPLAALDEYETWITKAAGDVDDRGLLEPIAFGLLRGLSADADPTIRATALEALARAGDDDAVEKLRKRSAGGDRPAMQALVRSGDANSIRAVQTLLATPTGRDMSAEIKALAEHGGLTPSLLQSLAADRVPMNRAAVASALVASKDAAAAQLLDALNQDRDPLVRTSIVLARAQAGDERGLAEAKAMLASEVPDIRLTAAESLVATMPRESEQAVRPLLSDRDGINRFRAAAIVGRFDPVAALPVITEGLTDQNRLIQQQAARTLAQTLPAETRQLRQLLRHPDRLVVAHAASAVVAN